MIIKLKPIPVKKIWGGDKLSTQYNLSLSNVGEVWGISAHKSQSNLIMNGDYKGITLRELYIKHEELFGNLKYKEFPLLFKIIDAKEDLSIQVHPGNEYALKNENSYGKDEFWYVLETHKDSKIQIGHNYLSKKDFYDSLKKNIIQEKLIYSCVNVGDCFYISSGTVHAICKNTTILEVSQSSDITYRIFDYSRTFNGKPRKLNIEKALDVIEFPYSKKLLDFNDKFTFNILKITKEISIKSHKYGDYAYVIEGNGSINNINISKGEFFIVTAKSYCKIIGKLKIAIINIK